ncbi:unnamed protein product [Haemonchus placei]|uniref:Uncharacterized protein n=1 Tax=Haemonchus placei TaxID=6290 RepID=A0A3P7VQU9_HAEPC|nr:unnamed protein product [Haemonchus placei]
MRTCGPGADGVFFGTKLNEAVSEAILRGATTAGAGLLSTLGSAALGGGVSAVGFLSTLGSAALGGGVSAAGVFLSTFGSAALGGGVSAGVFFSTLDSIFLGGGASAFGEGGLVSAFGSGFLFTGAFCSALATSFPLSAFPLAASTVLLRSSSFLTGGFASFSEGLSNFAFCSITGGTSI